MDAQKYLGFSFLLYCVNIFFTIVGIFIIDRFDCGYVRFNLKTDLKKSAVCSIFELGPTLFLFYFAQTPKVFLLYMITFWIFTKLAYLRITSQELIVLGLIKIVGIILSAHFLDKIVVTTS